MKLAIRLTIRNPFFSLINIFGLSIGFTSFIALWQYSTDGLKSDQHHKDFERIARIGFHWRWTENGESGTLTFGGSKANIIPELKRDFPEVESYVRVLEQAGFFQEDLLDKHGTKTVVTYLAPEGREISINQKKSAYADKNFFEFFGIPLVFGYPQTALSGSNSVAISRSTAIAYFGDEFPIGKELSLNDSIPLVVSAVYEDMPVHSRLQYDLVLSNEGLLGKWHDAYWGGTTNFVKLAPETSFKQFQNKINQNVQKYWASTLNSCKCQIEMFAQPLKEVAFSQGFIGDEAFRHPSKTIFVSLGAVSIAILIMAWINYVNLAVTRMNNRMKEVSTRRANGATASDLLGQFVTESFVTNALAIGISVTLLQLIRTPLATIFEIHIKELWMTSFHVWIILCLALISATLVTGLYPGLICIARNHGVFLKRSSRNANSTLIASTTIAQLAIAIVLMSCIFVVYLQLNYVLSNDIGLDKEGVVTIEGPVVKPDHYDRQMETLADQITNLQGIKRLALSRYALSSSDGDKPGGLTVVGGTVNATAFCNGVDENYIPFFNLKLLAGRNFVNGDRGDVLIISRIAAKELGFYDPRDAIGVEVEANTGNWQISETAEVIGVVEDYRTLPLFDYSNTNSVVAKGEVGLFFAYKNKLFPDLVSDNIVVKVTLKDVEASMRAVESLYRTYFPHNIFEWRFLDDQINQAYASEKVMRNQILLFTFLAVAIACLGLIATITQRIADKTKEIGIRKVFGARDLHIGRLLLNTLLAQFTAAAMLALPVAFYLNNQYLQKYSERTTIAWWYYIGPLAVLIVIMLVSIASMLVKAARTNPIESLRSE